MKKLCVVLSIVCVGLGIITYRTANENQCLCMINTLNSMENRILREDLYELSQKRTYEDGYKDALVKCGGPTNGGVYQQGWDDAQKIFENAGFSEGYHSCLFQFSYQKPDTTRYLASIRENDKSIQENKEKKLNNNAVTSRLKVD